MTYFSSVTRFTLFDDNVLALYINVLTTAALCATGWWESKDRYWLVCVAFLNTEDGHMDYSKAPPTISSQPIGDKGTYAPTHTSALA